MIRTPSVIRDPVHGDIHLTAEELRLLDTHAIQRLRGVRQLGTAYLVYPGAQHTRFEHSLGTMHMTVRLVRAINRNRAAAPLERIGVADDEERILRAAALVHDVTHIPFGHNIEDQSAILARHDSGDRFRTALSPETELGRRLDAMGIRREVLAVLLPEGAADVPAIPPFWREILSDTICADILDYLRRDAYFTGLNLQYDDRVLDYFMVDRATGHLYVDVAKRGLLREDILSELIRVLDARYYFSERVYYHHAKITAGALISRAVEVALEAGTVRPAELLQQTDGSLIALLEARLPPDRQESEQQRELLDRFQRRALLKRACVYPRYANRDVQASLVERFFAAGSLAERRRFEREIQTRTATMVGAPGPRVVLYCPAHTMQLKEAQTHVRLPGGEGIVRMSSLRERVPRLGDLERSYRNLWKMYVLAASSDPHVLGAVAEAAAEELPEAVNMYRTRAGSASR